MRSGTMSSIGSTVQLSIRYVAGGCYDIRLNSNSYYLARSGTSSNKNVVLQSSADIRYTLWKIETYTYNGYTYHYFYNSETYEYLIWQNGTLQVVSTLPYPGTEAFYACSWRVASPESGVFRELSSVTIDNMWLPSGAEEQPVIHANPSSADLCAPFDFTYTCDTAYVGVDALEGYITPNNHTGSYTKTITATHKPTGITTTFSLTMNPKGLMLSIPESDGRDRTSCLSAAIQHLSNSGYSGGYLAEGNYTTDQVSEFMDDATYGSFSEDYTYNVNSIFVSRSHGDHFVTASGGPAGTGILINDQTGKQNDIWYRSDEIPASLDLSNMRIMIFGGCYTGAYKTTGLNLPSVAVARGAKVAIGFEVSIRCGMVNKWIELFFEELSEGSTVQEAVMELNEKKYTYILDGEPVTEYFSVMKPYIAGDGTVTLN